jgi:DNA polymerase-1
MDTIEGGTFTYLVDCITCDPSPLWKALAERELVLHNAAFDLAFLARLGFTPNGVVRDTMLLSQVLHAQRRKGLKPLRHRLEDVTKRELGRTLDKSLQKSDWSGQLSSEQLEYAARDAAVLAPLHRALEARLRAAGLVRAAEIECGCLPAMVSLAGAGVPFDPGAWEALAHEAEKEAQQLARRLDDIVPHQDGCQSQERTWNWRSHKDVRQVFALLGFHLETTEDATLAGIDHPLAELLRCYRGVSRRASAYGLAWLKNVVRDGRVYADWRQIGCVTGRMACSKPNLQNLPGGPYRRCFSAPPGRVLVKADYSQIELRIAAKVADDKAMLDAYARGEDLHDLTAQRMLGKAIVTTAERRRAKPVNFGLIYGLGVDRLRQNAKADYDLDLTEKDAERYRRAFFSTYPGIRRWHEKIRGAQSTETRTLAGRRCLVDADAFYGMKANYIVQGTGGDGIKLALALLWERRQEVPGAFPVLVVHDEIVVECDASQADSVATWLKRAMEEAMFTLIAPVPVDVAVKVGKSWGGDDLPSPASGGGTEGQNQPDTRPAPGPSGLGDPESSPGDCSEHEGGENVAIF